MLRTLSGLLFFGVSVATAAAADPIRLGWQTTWATQGQLVVGLQKSNIPELVGVELDYPGFAFGGPLNQAALAGQVDLLLTAHTLDDLNQLTRGAPAKDADIHTSPLIPSDGLSARRLGFGL